MITSSETINTSEHLHRVTASGHSICWAAIFGGAFVAIALSLILLMLGSALGFASVSPWSNTGASATTFTVGLAIWLIVMQWVSSAFGGYLAGRLRAKWVNLHTDEVLFRDTAHGFLAWAVATVFTVGLLGSAATGALSQAVHVTSAVASGAAMGASHSAKNTETDPMGYYVDSLYRKANPGNTATSQDTSAETTRILVADMKNDTVPDEDKAYLSHLVAARAGISQDEAQQRVDKTIADLQAAKQNAKEEADAARKSAAKLSLYLFLSMLIGAFVATAGGALGGQHRDLI